MCLKDEVSDYTKTKTYAVIDLASKTISALALVALGIAGWMLQLHTEKTREAAQQFEQQERRYLPMLRSLSVLELHLEDSDLNQQGEGAEKTAYNIGTDLRFVAESVFVPDGDPQASLRRPEIRSDDQIRMPVRAAAIMYAELMRMKLFTKDAPHAETMHLDAQKSVVVFEDSEHQKSITVHVAPDSLPAWKAWMGDRVLEWSKVRDYPPTWLMQDLRFACSRVIHDVLSRHVDLGDRYVQIRDEVEKNRSVVK